MSTASTLGGAAGRRLPHGSLHPLTGRLLPPALVAPFRSSGPEGATTPSSATDSATARCSGRTDRGRRRTEFGPRPEETPGGRMYFRLGQGRHGRDCRQGRTGEPRRPRLGAARLRAGVRRPAVERRRRRRHGRGHAGPPPERGRAPGPGGTAHRRRHPCRRTPGGTTAGRPGDRPHRQPVHEHRLRGRPAPKRTPARPDRSRGP